MTPPWRLNEVLDRAETGPICVEKDFELKVLVPKLKQVIKQYDIRVDPENPVPSDDSLADDLWKAALDLYLEVGTLCTSTHRRMLFDESEIREAMKNFPGRFVVGYGKDSREMFQRKAEDPRRPFCLFSPDITCDEELFVPMSMAYLQEPLADGVCAPILEEVEGRSIKTGAASEMKGAVAHAMMLREAARRVGRPGIFLQGVGTAQSHAAQIAASNPIWGERLTDGRFVASISELKVDYSLLNKMIHFHQYGSFVGALTGPMLGGYCGGPEGTAVVGAAYHIQGLMVNQAHYLNYFPFHIKHMHNTTGELLWGTSLVYQALARNTPLISLSNGFAAAGPCTQMVLYEAAAHGLASVVSGANLWEIAVARNKYKNRATPMEAKMSCEVGCGAAESGIKRAEANELVKRLASKYEHQIAEAPLGKTFQECYDVKRIAPGKEYTELYRTVKKELLDMGVPFAY
ncbi:monomethylamine:corrinoid methyltransferase [[Eubacterium] cellulosolvens]